MSTTSIFHCINVPCNGWCGSRSLSVGGGGGVHKKSQINRRMIHSNPCHRFLSKTVKNNQNYLLKAEIKNITNCSSQRWDKRFFG